MRRFAPSIALGFASLLILGLSPDHGYAESAGMAAAQAVVDAHSGTPAFQAPGPPSTFAPARTATRCSPYLIRVQINSYAASWIAKRGSERRSA
jgi:hypothetical protein